MAITMVRTFKTQQRPIKGYKSQTAIQETHCRACNVLLIEHNHSCEFEAVKTEAVDYCNICEHWYCNTCEHCKSTEGMEFVTPDISATIADVENYLLADYERYRDMLTELKALPPGITHADGDTDNNTVDNLKLEERKPVDYTLETSGLDAGQPYKVDNTLTWEENIKNWEEREPIPYPEGYTQGIVLFEDDKPIYKTECINDKCKFKTLVKFEKVKKTRKSKIGVC
jgi:hypothetical protein